MSGLSIANNLLAGRVQLNLNKNQAALQQAVTSLSSGLRINSAADDPSGLAISTNLQTQVDAFNTASQNVQNANNAAQVADGALATETDILQRIRNLAVEASSSIDSSSDTANLQSEVSQLLLEVNRISQSVTFNGQPLLDGSHAGFQPYVDASYSVTSNAVLANAGGGAAAGPAVTAPNMSQTGVLNVTQVVSGLTPGAAYNVSFNYAEAGVTNWSLSGNSGTYFSDTGSGNSGSATATDTADASGNITLVLGGADAGTVTISGITLTPAAPSGASGNLVAGVTQVTTTATGFITSGSTVFDTSNSGAVDGTIELQVVNTSSTTVGVEVQFFSSAGGGNASPVVYAANAAANSLVSVDGLNISIGNVTLADAGTTSYIKVSQAAAAASSSSGPFTVQSGSEEGDTVQIGIQATNAQTLRISNINIANTNAPLLAAEDAIGQIDNALQTLLSQRAQLGSVIVRLNEDAGNNSVAAVNLQASESSIRDLDVGEATTEFTKLQVLVQVGTSVLAQSNSNQQSVLGLFR